MDQFCCFRLRDRNLAINGNNFPFNLFKTFTNIKNLRKYFYLLKNLFNFKILKWNLKKNIYSTECNAKKRKIIALQKLSFVDNLLTQIKQNGMQ